MDCQSGFLYTPKLNVLYSSTRSRSACETLFAKFSNLSAYGCQNARSVGTGCAVEGWGKGKGGRPVKRASNTISPPQTWARVSRTEEKLEPSGLANCASVSCAAASSARLLAQWL